MQEITVDRRHLLDFSTEYGRLPDMTMGNPLKVKGTHILAVAWLAAYLHHNDKVSNELAIAFTGWLCGRNEFIIAETSEQDFVKALVALVAEVVDVSEMANASK